LAADGVVVVAPAQAEYFHVAGGGVEKSLDDFERGGLAGPVGAKQPEALAGEHIQVEATNCFDRRPGGVCLHKATDAGGGCHVGILGNRRSGVRPEPYRHHGRRSLTFTVPTVVPATTTGTASPGL